MRGLLFTDSVLRQVQQSAKLGDSTECYLHYLWEQQQPETWEIGSPRWQVHCIKSFEELRMTWRTSWMT